jgi:hypothetical protein
MMSCSLVSQRFFRILIIIEREATTKVQGNSFQCAAAAPVALWHTPLDCCHQEQQIRYGIYEEDRKPANTTKRSFDQLHDVLTTPLRADVDSSVVVVEG